ncbi:MAG: hypothetical protein E7260_09300 [Lachnospiraceae bacterium]|nr:hypothetical protein [Lachnospiraceae bacterium]
MQKKIKKFKRRIRKRIYHFLLALNEFRFRKLWPVFAGIGFVALLITACLLPTTSKTNTGSPLYEHGAAVAGDIRTTVTGYSTLECAADVVAVFLPTGYETLSETAFLSAMEGKHLYSFYLTGRELYHLAEHAVALKSDTHSLFLDGLTFTFHENRLPFDRVKELSLANGTSVSSDDSALYHIVTTEEIFTLFHYGSYRSLGLLDIVPKDRYGIQLSDYQKAVVSKDNAALTVASAIAYAAMHPSGIPTGRPASVITTLGGYNLIALWSTPNHVTVLICLMFFTAVVLVWFALPRLHRVVLWIKIYAIRSKKRGRHVLYSKRRFSGSRYYRRAG